MKRVAAALALMALAALALAGCQAEKERTWAYGESFHAIFENQKLDPRAGDGSPVTGFDGDKAAQAYDRYEKAKPSEKEVRPILNIGK
ncbi:hypothetical protein [Solidesulfovibrio sp.]|uniref:hypothetical protein n=1 Tax=Solidesulfovibrio sp. TaxID=2910990 RepID=UPI00260F57F5|nr:hypothetical protein [Solidesulfovibrio sp.]